MHIFHAFDMLKGWEFIEILTWYIECNPLLWLFNIESCEQYEKHNVSMEIVECKDAVEAIISEMWL